MFLIFYIIFSTILCIKCDIVFTSSNYKAVFVGDSITINCTSTNDNIKWLYYFDDKYFINNYSDTYEIEKYNVTYESSFMLTAYNLIIRNATMNHAGEYICYDDNEKSKPISLAVVSGNPICEFNIEPSKTSLDVIKTNNNIDISCSISYNKTDEPIALQYVECTNSINHLRIVFPMNEIHNKISLSWNNEIIYNKCTIIASLYDNFHIPYYRYQRTFEWYRGVNVYFIQFNISHEDYIPIGTVISATAYGFLLDSLAIPCYPPANYSWINIKSGNITYGPDLTIDTNKQLTGNDYDDDERSYICEAVNVMYINGERKQYITTRNLRFTTNEKFRELTSIKDTTIINEIESTFTRLSSLEYILIGISCSIGIFITCIIICCNKSSEIPVSSANVEINKPVIYHPYAFDTLNNYSRYDKAYKTSNV